MWILRTPSVVFEFVVEPVWSWPLVVLAGAALIGIVLVTYPPRVRHLPPLWRRTLIGLRLLAALVLIFAMLRPAVRYSEIDKQAARIVVLMDASRSMTTADAPGGFTRREALVRTLMSQEESLKELADQVELRFIDFAEELAPVDEADPKAAQGRSTAIGRALDEIRKEDAGKRLVGVILMSDGAQRATGEDAIDPRTAARRFAEQRGVPVHTFTYGSAELSGVGLDLAIEDVVVDPLAYEKKTVPVRFQLRTTGASGRDVKVRLLIEQRSSFATETRSEMVELPLSADARPFAEYEIRTNRGVNAHELSFVAEEAGEYKLAVEAAPLEGEVKQTNNRYETVITVLKGGLKVAYFDVVRSAEQKFIGRLNESAKIQLDEFLGPGGERLDQVRIDPALFEPGRYDVYIIGDVPAFVFQQAGRDLLQELALRCRDGAGLAMLGGTFNYGAGGYADSAIASLLPVKMSPAEELSIGEDQPATQFIPGPIQMLPGPSGRSHYLMQLGPNSVQLWNSLPELKNGANRLERAGPAANVLAQTKSGEPLLLGWDTGQTRVLASAVSDTWRWYTHGYSKLHQRFWEQFLLWLARMENETDQPVWARVSPRNYAPGDRVTIAMGARDDQNNPVADASFTVEVVGPDGETTTLPTQRSGEETVAEFAATEEAGDYWVIVTGTKNGAPLGPQARTRFIVDARDPEMDNPAADPDLMAEIATITGAVPVEPEDFGEFLDSLLEEGLAAEVTRHTQFNLWDDWPLLLVFVLLLTTEWFVRKRRGLV
jgi:hypothetical protein